MLAKVVTRNADFLKVKLASNKLFVEPKVFFLQRNFFSKMCGPTILDFRT